MAFDFIHFQLEKQWRVKDLKWTLLKLSLDLNRLRTAALCIAPQERQENKIHNLCRESWKCFKGLEILKD